MNAADPPGWLPPASPAGTVDAPPLHRIALAALAAALPPGLQGAEADWLRSQALCSPDRGDDPAAAAALALRDWPLRPPRSDAGLHAVATALGLDIAETLATALALAVEFDAMAGRALAWLQAPVGATRPTLGLVASLAPLLAAAAWRAGGAAEADLLATLCQGRARASGLWQFDGETRPLTELALQLPLPLALAMQAAAGGGGSGSGDNGGGDGGDGSATPAPAWPGLRWLDPPTGWPASLQQAARVQALALQALGPDGVLVLRSGDPREARQAAAAVAAELGQRAIGLALPAPAGLGPWLDLVQALPVVRAELAPGETLRLAPLAGWQGPRLVAAGIDGQVQADGDPVVEWTVPLPLPAERIALWSVHLPQGAAQRMGQRHRHSALQIEQLARTARHAARLGAESSGDAALTEDQARHATRQGSHGALGALAQWLPDPVCDEALVATTALRDALDTLCQRCERRDGLADVLGPAARTRYRPGVRALLVGASGTGKTLAAGWLASRLGLPLYRVDLASVSSKYIGETEKNLAQLFARAEHAEGVLLFDEADSLFGKRTEVKDANDRFANQQTNYLLQRIESFDGIALLTSNSRARFDAAFTRRLDAIIEFPTPGPDERRALWLAHLGSHHRLNDGQINRVAVACDLAGGHIRNATLTAAAAAAEAIDYPRLCSAIGHEYRKLGRALPAGL